MVAAGVGDGGVVEDMVQEELRATNMAQELMEISLDRTEDSSNASEFSTSNQSTKSIDLINEFNLLDPKTFNKIYYMLTNARSLAPKICSLLNYFRDFSLHFSVITESWLASGTELDNALAELENGTDLRMLYKNRPVKPSSRRRTAGGGVAIVYDKSKCKLK